MTTFILLTRLTPGAISEPRVLENLERRIMEHIRAECPNVKWLSSFAVLGPYDYLDLFEAPDFDSAIKVSAIVRTCGHAHTQVWPATHWSRFKELIRELPRVTS
jgi:uncharacterized protein with GYD domain